MIQLKLEPCIPPVWAPSGHAQTVLGHILPSKRLAQTGKRVEIDLPDGDKLVAFYIAGTSTAIVYLFHGLAGSTDSTYIHRTAQVALDLGHSVIMVNHRGCGAGARLAKHPYHSGRGEDLSAAIAWGKKEFPRKKHLAIGFSLSGNALLLLLAGKRGTTLPDYAISVNAPINLQGASDMLSKGFNRVYDAKFFLQCRRDVMKSRAIGAKTYDIPYFKTLREFDNIYTAPAGGFKNREDYYSSCSTAGLLTEIKTPTLAMTANDDPFVDVFDYLQAKTSPQVSMHNEKFGGHMGYLSKTSTPIGTFRWQDYALREAIRGFVPN
ncbi:MAG: YheT family hydrolase [Bdellovibrionales bacterium]